MKNYYFIFLFGLTFSNIFSQSIDSVQIKQEVGSVLISATKIDSIPYINKEQIFELEENEKMSFTTLEKVLDNQSNISLKKYGEGQISTISVKGFNASQTNVVWNGVNINSPLLGQADISTITVGNNTVLSLQETNSDNIAGEVSVKHNFDYRKIPQLNVISSATSFGSFNQGVSFEFSKKRKFYSNSNVSFSYNLNKYKYINESLPNQKEIYLENAETLSFHFEQVNGFKLKKNNEIRLFFKAFYADRNIPPTIYEFLSTKNQKNNKLLGKIEWRKLDFEKKYQLRISSAFVSDIQKYKLSKTSNPIKFDSNSWQTDLIFNKALNKFKLIIKLKNNLENGNSNNFNDKKWRNKLNIKPMISFVPIRHLELKASLAEILVNHKFSQPLPAAAIKYTRNNLPASILLQFDYSRKTRIPSLNDLFWNLGGNINLKEEYSHNFNFNFIIERDFKPLAKKDKFYFKNEIEIFNILAENYIQWQPTSKGYWESTNIGNVYSRGITNNLTLKYSYDKNWSFQNILSYNFTKITKTKEMEQLVYVPMNSINNSTKIATKWFDFIVNQQFVSEKFTSYDNSLSIEEYYLLDFIVSKEFKINKSHEIYAAFEMNNTLNKTYFTYINRALPKRNFALKLKYTFQ